MYTHLSGKVAETWESISEMMDCEKVHAYQAETSSDLQNAEVINVISRFMPFISHRELCGVAISIPNMTSNKEETGNL